MNIFYTIKKLLTINSLIILLSCGLNPCSSIASDTANSRFEENKNYLDHPIPTIEDSNNFSFLVISDTHYQNKNLEVGTKLNEIRQKYNASFLIVNGDISETGQNKQFQLFLDDMKNYNGIIYPVLGNHDILNNGSKTFGKMLGKFIYSIEIGNIKLIFLDTSTGTFGNKQKEWYEKELSSNKKIIVFTHYNFVTSTVQEIVSMSNAEDEYYFYKTNSKHNVKYVISGHLHKNNKKEIRGVKYQTLTKLQDKKESILLFSIKDNEISNELLNLP